MLYANRKLLALFFLIVLIGATPPILVILSPIKSFAIGCLITASLGILMALRNINKIKKIKPRTLLLIAVIIFYIGLQHSFVGVWQEKSYSSILPLIIIIISAYLLSQEIARLNDRLILKAFRWSYYVFSCIGIINIITGYSIGKSLGYTHAQPIFPFLEPSHYSLYFGPLAFIYITLEKQPMKKGLGLALIIALSLTIPNTTLLTYACLSILMMVYSFRVKILFLILPVFIALTIYGTNAVLSNEYFSKRLSVSSDSGQNTTTLVYLQGMQDAINSFSITNGLGLGFQMLGTQPPSDYAYTIAKLMSDVNGELNRQDGGFLAAKIIAEFGILGLFVVLAFTVLCAKSFINIRDLSKKNARESNTKEIIFSCIVATFCIEMFIRGYGYFSPGLYIFLISVFYLDALNKSKRREIPIKEKHSATINKQALNKHYSSSTIIEAK